MHILVTGGCGFIGHKLINLLEKDNIITTIDNLSSGYKENLSKHINIIIGDCGDENLINNINTKFDIIIHLAAQSGGEGSFDDVMYDLNSNVKSTLLLLNLAKRINCKHFIFTSTVAVYGGINNKTFYSEDDSIDPHTFYAVNKLTSEYYIKLFYENYNINYTIYRLFNCYGPGQNLNNLKQGMISIYLRQLIDTSMEKVIVKGSFNRIRDFIYIDDVTNIINITINNPNFFNQIVNLGTGIKTSVGEIIDILKEIGDYDKEVLQEGTTSGDMNIVCANNSKLLSLCNNYCFTKVKDGIKKG